MAVLPLIAAGASIVGTGISVIGQIQAGNAAADAAKYNASIAEQNATLAQQQSAEQERVFRINAQKQQGMARAAIGASGVTGEGSPEDVLANNAANQELDALKIRHEGDLKALGYQESANLDQFRGSSAQTGAILGASGTLLQGLSKGSTGVYNYFKGGGDDVEE